MEYKFDDKNNLHILVKEDKEGITSQVTQEDCEKWQKAINNISDIKGFRDYFIKKLKLEGVKSPNYSSAEEIVDGLIDMIWDACEQYERIIRNLK